LLLTKCPDTVLHLPGYFADKYLKPILGHKHNMILAVPYRL